MPPTEVVLPADRVIYADEVRPALLDPRTGELVNYGDAPPCLSVAALRLHRLDFGAVLRSRPVWDVIHGPAVAGRLAAVLLGLLMGVRRLARR